MWIVMEQMVTDNEMRNVKYNKMQNMEVQVETKQ